MGYLKVVLGGHKTNGGKLTVMKPHMSVLAKQAAEKKRKIITAIVIVIAAFVAYAFFKSCT